MTLKDSQNFIKSKTTVDKLLSFLPERKSEVVIELGPGKGMITEPLSKIYEEGVVAIEADKTLSERLKETFCTNKNIKIKNQDFLQYKLPTDDFDVVANIPFNITTEVIKKITQETNLKTAILIMQKEAGLRFVGLPNEKSSLISNILQINYDLVFLTKISRNEFTPKPKVDACIISIKRKDKNEDTDERWFKDFLTVVFTKAKPLLKDALKSVFTKVQINNICTKNKIKPNTHIRSITFTQWVSLFNVFETHCDKKTKLKTKGAYKKLLKEQSKLEKSHRTRKY